jgi:AbiU2
MMQPDEKANNLLEHLKHQLAKGWSSYLVAKYVRDARVSKSINSLRWFLGITEEACIEAAILALSRIVVSQHSSISIQYLLAYLEQNPNAFPHIVADVLRKQVAFDQKRLETISTTIENIKEQRDRTLAHLDKRHVDNPAAVYNHLPLDYQEVERVFELLLDIINRYTGFMKPSVEFTLKNMEPDIADDIRYLTELIRDDDARP